MGSISEPLSNTYIRMPRDTFIREIMTHCVTESTSMYRERMKVDENKNIAMIENTNPIIVHLDTECSCAV
jgi:hypothetical protein